MLLSPLIYTIGNDRELLLLSQLWPIWCNDGLLCVYGGMRSAGHAGLAQPQQGTELIKAVTEVKRGRQVTFDQWVEAVVYNQLAIQLDFANHLRKRNQGVMHMLEHVCANKRIIGQVFCG